MPRMQIHLGALSSLFVKFILISADQVSWVCRPGHGFEDFLSVISLKIKNFKSANPPKRSEIQVLFASNKELQL